MRQYDRLKQLQRDISFNPIHCDRSDSNKNVSTGAVIRAKRGTDQLGVRKLLANYQTDGYKFRPMSGWNGRIGSQPFVSEHIH